MDESSSSKYPKAKARAIADAGKVQNVEIRIDISYILNN